jgi:hypothetical protein
MARAAAPTSKDKEENMADPLDPLGVVANIRAQVTAAGSAANLATAIFASGLTQAEGFVTPSERVEGFLDPKVDPVESLGPQATADQLQTWVMNRYHYQKYPAWGYGPEEAAVPVLPETAAALGFAPGQDFNTGTNGADRQSCLAFTLAVLWKMNNGLPVDGQPMTAEQLAAVMVKAQGAAEAAAAGHQAELRAWWALHPSSPRPPDLAWSQYELELHGPRHRVRGIYTTSAGASGRISFTSYSQDSGIGWFFGPSNPELIVKVLDGGGAWWFFAAGPTDVGVTLEVSDTQTGASKKYSQPAGSPFAPILDTSALPKS